MKWSKESIKILMDKLEMTQLEFAVALKSNPVTINRWLNGHNLPDLRGKALLNDLEASHE